jgi:hypothetical protein
MQNAFASPIARTSPKDHRDHPSYIKQSDNEASAQIRETHRLHVRIPVLPEFESSGKVIGIHQPPDVSAAVRYPERLQSLPINHLLFHRNAPEVGAVATAQVSGR